MGDGVGGAKELGAPDLAHSILELGIRNKIYDDEIYCQICKQITKNPSVASEEKGWDLLSLCLQFFAPSSGLYEWLVNFIKLNSQKNLNKTPNIYVHVSFCNNRVKKMNQTGGTGVVPSLDQIPDLLKVPFLKKIFGVGLSDIMALQQDTDPNGLPRVLTCLAECVKQSGGMGSEGIFRVPGNAAEMTNFRIRLEKGEYSVVEADPNVPASLLKLWLRELTTPIIPTNLFDEAICHAQHSDSVSSCQLILKLEALNQRIVYYIVDFLRYFLAPEVVSKTLMTVENLAMVFAPNFLRCPSGDPAIIFSTQKHQQLFVKHLLLDLDTSRVSWS